MKESDQSQCGLYGSSAANPGEGVSGDQTSPEGCWDKNKTDFLLNFDLNCFMSSTPKNNRQSVFQTLNFDPSDTL